ncbi:alcohol dehydrogenase catalytic domain-containing protein [Oceanobacillus sp. FSL K6-2867]|uniref:zinc-dependent alcohol dehydrogenase n=1 Tax=Oceanobacillus sp. FSL K6-2867 TaxID=2954748 RepID=UPI0030D9E840
MKALVKTSRLKNALERLDVKRPIIQDDEVLVQVVNVAICGTDLHVYEFTAGYDFIQTPLILGHEFSGYIAEVGSKVVNFHVGDRVIGESNRYCGQCDNCNNGRTDICLDSQMTGLHVNGAMAEYIAVPAYTLHHLPNNLPFSVGAIAQPISVSLNAVFDNCNLNTGDNVVIFGPGIQGLSAAQAARIKGASKVAIVGTDNDEEIRLPIAKEMGFDTFNVNQESINQQLLTIWDGKEVDVVIDASGSIHAVKDGMSLLKRGGHLTLFGIYPRTLELDLTSLVRRNITIHTSYTSQWKHYEQALKFLSKRQIDISALIKEYPFEEFEKAFEDGIAKTVLKPVLTLSQ